MSKTLIQDEVLFSLVDTYRRFGGTCAAITTEGYGSNSTIRLKRRTWSSRVLSLVRQIKVSITESTEKEMKIISWEQDFLYTKG